MSTFSTGWVDDPGEVDRICSMLPIPVFGSVSDSLKGTELRDVASWDLEEKVTGGRLETWQQGSVGSCVSHGSGRAAQTLLLQRAAVDPIEMFVAEVAREPIYGGSRVEVGGGKIRGDGSVGAWAAKWLNEWGVLLAQKYNDIDLTKYDEVRCRDWGRRGVPDVLEPEARSHPVKTTSLVKSANDARDLMCNGFWGSVCSGQGFSMKRQTGGFCRAEGTWYHCMFLAAYLTVRGKIPCFAFLNSWGDYLGSDNATVKLESGRDITLPPGAFLADYDVVDRMLKQGDTWFLSDLIGWRKRSLNWMI